MTEFFTPTDIGNRALQHCGAERMDAQLGFTTPGRNAKEVSFAYGKLRRAELRANVWTFATRRVMLRQITSTTMQLAPALWVQSTTYFRGSIVSDDSGNLWISRIPNNLGYDPQNSLTWEPYFGPLTASLYDQSTGYSAGEVVYTAVGDGTSRTYISLQNNNTDNPAVATVYDATATYMKNAVISYLGVPYMSLIDLNIGNTPNLAPALFNPATVYAAGNKVGASDGLIYTSLSNGNTGHDPVLDPTHTYWTTAGVLNPWTTVFVGGAGSNKWLLIGGTEFPNGVGLTTIDMVYPIGASPNPQAGARNYYRLPSGYLRQAPQYPKGTPSWLGGPTGITYNDWNFENGYLVTSDYGPIAFRCVVDITDVTMMDDMFCEGLAARIGMEVCETLTQSSAKLGTIAKVYDEFMSRAKTANAIEQGYDDPPEDDYISVRI